LALVTEPGACSHHLADEVVDVLLSVAGGTEALTELMSLLLEATNRVGELEGPEEVVGLLEVGTAGDNLVDEILHAVDTLLAELTSNDGVIGEGDSASVDLTVTTLVDELGDGGAGGETVGDERLDHADHVPGGLVELDKHTVVDLAETEKLHDLSLLGGKLVDTADSDNESDLSLVFDEEGAGLLGITARLDERSVSSSVLLFVFDSVGGGDLTLGSNVSLFSLAGFDDGFEDLGVTGGLLDKVLGHNSSTSLLLGLPKTTSR